MESLVISWDFIWDFHLNGGSPSHHPCSKRLFPHKPIQLLGQPQWTAPKGEDFQGWKITTGWWFLATPLKKYDFVNWDDNRNPINMGK